MNLDRHVWEGWTVQDFVDELEPSIKMIMENNSYIKKFENKKQLKNGVQTINLIIKNIYQKQLIILVKNIT